MANSTLRSYAGNPDVDPDPGHLALRLRVSLDSYNRQPHESLGGVSPLERWLSDSRPLHPVTSRDWLQERFRIRVTRRVSGDNVVSLNSVRYEMPRGYAGDKVTLYRSPLEPDRLEFDEPGNKLIRLHPVDLHANAYQRRHRETTESEAKETQHITTAAGLAFHNTFAPIVGDDGGFAERSHTHAKEEREDEQE